MKKKDWIIIGALLVLLLCLIIFYCIPNSKYNKAESLVKEGKYSEALSLYQELGNFKDAKLMAEGGLQYQYAEYLLAEGKFEEAAKQFKAAADFGYTDASLRMYEPYYLLGEALLKEGKTEEALASFEKAGDYKDAKQRQKEAYLLEAEKLLTEGKYEEANEALIKAGTAERIGEPYYLQAEKLLAEGKFTEASEAFAKAGDYRSSKERILEPYYLEAEQKLAEGKYDEAVAAFQKAGNYKDAASRMLEPYYLAGKKALSEGKFDEAHTYFVQAGDYSDAKELASQSYYEKAERALTEGNYAEAVEAFRQAGDYKDAKERSLESYYLQGEALLAAGNYAAAREAFLNAEDYKNAKDMVLKTYYEEGKALLAENKAEEAYLAFSEAKNHLDAQTLAKSAHEIWQASLSTSPSAEPTPTATMAESTPIPVEEPKLLAQVDALLAEKDYADASALLLADKENEENKAKLLEIAKLLQTENKLEEALALYEALGNSEGIQAIKHQQDELAKEEQYQLALQALHNKDIETAIATFTVLGDYKDSLSQLAQSYYAKAIQALESGKAKEALEAWNATGYALSDYPAFATLASEVAKKALEAGDQENGLALLEASGQNEAGNEQRIALAQAAYQEGKLEEALSLLQSLEKVPAASELYNKITQAYIDKGDILEAYKLLNNSNSYEQKKLLPGLAKRLRTEAYQALDKGDVESYLDIYKNLYANGHLTKKEMKTAEFISFINSVHHFNYGKLDGKDMLWQPLEIAQGRLLAIAMDNYVDTNFEWSNRKLVKPLVENFYKNFDYKTERKHLFRTFFYLVDSKLGAVSDVLAHIRSLDSTKPANIWTEAKSTANVGYYLYDVEDLEFYSFTHKDIKVLRPAIDLKLSEDFMKLMNSEGYHFYDAEGKELKFVSSVEE